MRADFCVKFIVAVRLHDKIYTLIPRFVKMTKWQNYAVLNADNPHFSAFRASCRTGYSELSQIHWYSPGLSCTRRTTYGTPCWKRKINSSRSLRWLLSWTMPCRLSGKSCHKNTSTRRWRTSSSAWLPHGCGCQRWLRWASAVTMSIYKSAFSCRHQQTGCFQSDQLLLVKTTIGTLRNGEGCLG